MDFLFGLGQVLCIIGLLYGAYLSIAYADRREPSLTAEAEVQPVAHHEYRPHAPQQRQTAAIGRMREKSGIEFPVA